MKKIILKILVAGLLVTVVGVGGLSAEKDYKYSFSIHSGVAYPVYPQWFSDFYNPTINVGLGFGLKLNSRLTVNGIFSYYRYIPGDAWADYMSFDDGKTFVPLGVRAFYQRDEFDSFYEFLVQLKYRFTRKRISPYILAGAGLTIRKWPYGWFIARNYKETYFALGLHYLFSVGMGVEYRLTRRFSIFSDLNYNYSLLGAPKHIKGNIPLRFGIIEYFKFSKNRGE